jgi:hypothetical protein
MPRSKKMRATWAKTRRNPRNAATRKPSSSRNALLALRSAVRNLETSALPGSGLEQPSIGNCSGALLTGKQGAESDHGDAAAGGGDGGEVRRGSQLRERAAGHGDGGGGRRHEAAAGELRRAPEAEGGGEGRPREGQAVCARSNGRG